jgi:hypothetical protein
MTESNLSPHLPQVAGGNATIPAGSGGTLIIDTGLRKMRACTATIIASSLVPAFVEIEKIALVPGGTQKIKLYAYVIAGTAATAECYVDWIAIGD